MKAVWTTLSAMALVCFLAPAQAEDKKDDAKEVTLKGTITCAKCDLDIEKKCMTVIKVKEKDKDVIYYLDEKTGKANHGKICKTPMKGTVTGTVKDDGKKKVITVTELKFDE
jgi:hypothetical protein